MENRPERFGILVGGGPAPGINGVISAATIEARKNGYQVYGYYDGFQHLADGVKDQFVNLDITEAARIHDVGGSILRTSRANPTKDPSHMANVLRVLREHKIRYMVTIGGDDTAFSASKLAEAANGDLLVAHVPKTIDNDLPLEPGVPTFGFETARHFGSEVVSNLKADARTTPRWYVVVAMGRTAGHLALGIGKATSAPLTLIPEEFSRDKPLEFKEICDVVEGAIIKRWAQTPSRPYGVALLAEGLIEKMTKEEIETVFGSEHVEYDQHGHPRLDDLDLGPKVRDELRRRFKQRGLKMTMISKNLGYELRCADPIPFDREYTRNLGWGAARSLLQGKSGALITFVGGRLKPIYFQDFKRNAKGRLEPRLVDIDGESYRVAREYMIRLEGKDRSADRLAHLAKVAKLSEAEFLDRFGYLMTP